MTDAELSDAELHYAERSDAERSDAERSDAGQAGDESALLSRLKVIEDQPLETRAEHLAQIYDELRTTLEASDARPSA